MDSFNEVCGKKEGKAVEGDGRDEGYMMRERDRKGQEGGRKEEDEGGRDGKMIEMRGERKGRRMCRKRGGMKDIKRTSEYSPIE